MSGSREVPVNDRKARITEVVAQLVESGAVLTAVNDHPEMNHYAVAMKDPEGNEFDVV